MTTRKNRARISIALMLPLAAATLLDNRAARGQAASPSPGAASRAAPRADETRAPVTFTGGHATDPQDRGRPVALIAAALGVPPEVFRAAFRDVRPAPAGQEPHPEQVRQNKDALMHALGPYGVTNERLDAVSNYYRYRPGRGELWPTTPATAYATVRKGTVTGFTITNPGSGYSSPPEISVPGLEGLRVRASLSFSTDLRKNGGIAGIALDGAEAPAPARNDRPRRRPRP